MLDSYYPRKMAAISQIIAIDPLSWHMYFNIAITVCFLSLFNVLFYIWFTICCEIVHCLENPLD